jgi:hypothetical protein
MRACLHSYLGMTSCTKHGTGSQQYDLYGPIHGWVMLKWYDVFRSLLLLVNFFIVFDLFHVISMYYFSTLTWRSVMFPNAAKPNNGNLTVPPESSKDPSLSNIYLYIYIYVHYILVLFGLSIYPQYRYFFKQTHVILIILIIVQISYDISTPLRAFKATFPGGDHTKV